MGTFGGQSGSHDQLAPGPGCALVVWIWSGGVQIFSEFFISFGNYHRQESGEAAREGRIPLPLRAASPFSCRLLFRGGSAAVFLSFFLFFPSFWFIFPIAILLILFPLFPFIRFAVLGSQFPWTSPIGIGLLFVFLDLAVRASWRALLKRCWSAAVAIQALWPVRVDCTDFPESNTR